jgi:hypothetical protein
MLFLLLGVLGVGSMLALAFLIGKAPEAYETGAGLRVVRPPSKVKLPATGRLPVVPVLP